MWHTKMCYAHNKWKKTNNGKKGTADATKNQNTLEKRKIGYIRSGHHQTSADESKKDYLRRRRTLPEANIAAETSSKG